MPRCATLARPPEPSRGAGLPRCLHSGSRPYQVECATLNVRFCAGVGDAGVPRRSPCSPGAEAAVVMLARRDAGPPGLAQGTVASPKPRAALLRQAAKSFEHIVLVHAAGRARDAARALNYEISCSRCESVTGFARACWPKSSEMRVPKTNCGWHAHQPSSPSQCPHLLSACSCSSLLQMLDDQFFAASGVGRRHRQHHRLL